MLLWVNIAITAAQHNHRWTEGAIVDYMEQHPNRAYFSRLFRNGGLRTGMEVGVADGRFSEHFLLDAGDRIRKWYMVEPAPNAELVARYPAASLASTSAAASSPGPLARLWSWLRNDRGRSWQSRGIGTRTEIIHLPHLSLDPNIFSTVSPRSVDFIYIDSSHLYEVTKKELSAYWRLLRRGGVLAGHDYCDHGESATIATGRVCRGCHPVPRCLPYTEYGLAHGKPLGAPSKSQASVVKAVQEWVVLNGHTLHFTSETFTRSTLRADGMKYDLLLTSTRNPSWFVVKGRGNIGPVPKGQAQALKKIHGKGRGQTLSMVGNDKLVDAWNAVVTANNTGDIVECGVYKGGTSMVMAWAEIHRVHHRKTWKAALRTLWLFDTYEGLPAPTKEDDDQAVAKWSRINVTHNLDSREYQQGGQFLDKGGKKRWNWGPQELVRSNMLSTGYPAKKLRFIKGKVEETLSDPANLPTRISVLRLDTDWFTSTKMELEVLYPRLVPGGVLIIDDYCTWGGARKATDDFLTRHSKELEKVIESGHLCFRAMKRR